MKIESGFANCQLLFCAILKAVFYKGDNVRLLREVPEVSLPADSEGTVLEIQRDAEGAPLAVVVQFYAAGGVVRAVMPWPADALELVIGYPGGCTGVFWDLGKSPEAVVEGAMHAVLDRGIDMRDGSNAQWLRYDAAERFWRKEDILADRTGAAIVTAAGSRDGCLVAFSGIHRLHLEFRLRGAGRPYVLLHQRYESLAEQRLTTHPAMSLLRLCLNLYAATGAEFFALPVADNWLTDESFDTLLKPPYFPDLLLLPQSHVPQQMPPLFRTTPLTGQKAILTALPVKFAPHEAGTSRTSLELRLSHLRACESLGEKAYDQLYETRLARSATALYSDAKEAFHDAIRLAGELELRGEAERLSRRLEQIKAVFRSQFS